MGRRAAERFASAADGFASTATAADSLSPEGDATPCTRADKGADKGADLSAAITVEGNRDQCTAQPQGWRVESTAGGASATAPVRSPWDAPKSPLPLPEEQAALPEEQAAPVGGGHGSVPPARYAIIGAGLAGLATAWHLLVSEQQATASQLPGTCW